MAAGRETLRIHLNANLLVAGIPAHFAAPAKVIQVDAVAIPTLSAASTGGPLALHIRDVDAEELVTAGAIASSVDETDPDVEIGMPSTGLGMAVNTPFYVELVGTTIVTPNWWSVWITLLLERQT